MAMVRFGDVAERVNTKEDRYNTDLEFYVGGDHIESNALTVSGRGRIKEADLGPMFYFGFKPGDILFVTRNPHLRKSAKVDFPGICSEKTLVIATKDENVLMQNYLAGVMQSDDFWDFMEGNKSGSVNFFINWSTLADYEFDLPSLDRQRELAELLWAANDLKEKYKKLITASDEMLKAKFREVLRGAKCKEYVFAEICKRGPQNGFYRKGAEKDGSVPVLKMKQLFGNESMETADDCDLFAISPAELEKFKLTKNDLVFGRRSLVPEGAGKCRRVGELERPTIFESSMLRVTLNTEVALPYVVQVWSESPAGEKAIAALRSGTTVVGIKGSDLRQMRISLPPLDLQRQFVGIAAQEEKVKANLKKSIADVDNIIKGLING